MENHIVIKHRILRSKFAYCARAKGTAAAHDDNGGGVGILGIQY